jgi:hypothetical protein
MTRHVWVEEIGVAAEVFDGTIAEAVGPWRLEASLRHWAVKGVLEAAEAFQECHRRIKFMLRCAPRATVIVLDSTEA